ncbi:hypothetical protein CKO28_00275 [Rhodovibrio sodomensis]|uniref:PAS domain-containing protein n=1 Tax=Rhodovibrio sodomensis TaxID=1088 RepID=A0ABS1D7Z5_9PROT|nr:hypothetical protein [Rhodovibrio sodomensis]MBK1666475.1 hypothetical protein [Rhodovibrio sodomensis]
MTASLAPVRVNLSGDPPGNGHHGDADTGQDLLPAAASMFVDSWLQAEWDRVPPRYGQRGLARMAELGVSFRAITLCGTPRPARVVTEGRLFHFAELEGEGERMLIQPVYASVTPSLWVEPLQPAALIDLIAYRTDAPDDLYTRCGESGLVLGMSEIHDAQLFERPLPVFRTPLSWLAAEGDGICVLDWRWAAGMLTGVPHLVGEDPEHDAEIIAHLTTPPPSRPRVGPVRPGEDAPETMAPAAPETD